MRLAQKILTQYQSNPGQSPLQAALAVQQNLEKSQDQRIVQELKKHQIDWQLTPSKKPVRLEVNVHTEWQSPDGKTWVLAPLVIPVDSQIRFQITVKNVGKAAVSRLLALTKSDHTVFDRHELPVGYLAPGASQTRYFQVKLPKSMVNSIHAVDFDFVDHHMKKQASQQIFLATKALPSPRFEFSLELIDDGRLGSEGNGDQIIQTEEKIALRLKVKNIGNGGAEKTLVLLKKDHIQPEVFLFRSRVVLGPLAPQQEKSAVLLFQMKKKDFKEGALLNDAKIAFKLLIEIQNEVLKGSDLVYLFDSDRKMLPRGRLYQAPEIDFEVGKNHVVNRVTLKKEIELKGIARDDRQLKDIFVFLNERKIFFQTNMGKTPTAILPFATTLNLKEGHNQILLFARDQDNLTISREIQLWHPKSSS